MPTRTTHLPTETAENQKNHSYELLVANWLMQAGWQVFVPLLDDAHCTDLLISDGPKFYRIQVKTVGVASEDKHVSNHWTNACIDYVVFFAKNSTWGYVCPAFTSRMRRLNHPEHQKFEQNKKSFLKAFHAL